MKISIRKLFIYILLILTIMILFTASLTLARYSDEYESSGTYPGDIEYVVSDQVEIKSVEEFFAAIENGYSNVIIADEVDNPIIISGGISDVHSDLVIDLNGHTIQRNNREPLLNVTQGVRLTIIDSSEEQDGSFYNPVGSVLRISGGTLTVAAGEFESGPRNGKGDVAKSEYYGSVTTGNYTDYRAHFSGNGSVTLKTSENASSGTTETMPIIIPGVQPEGNTSRSVNGNIYLDKGYSYGNDSFPADTYLYFTLDDETVENSTIAATGSANYLYSYYLNNDLKQYVGATSTNTTGETRDILVTIYVYEDVKATAADKSTFSAIDMSSGNLYVRGGKYFSYFGVDNTYCVNATGGYMSIEKGDFNAYGRSVCVQCAYDGQSNVETEYLHVTDGTFFSEIGDTIGVSGGRMIVSKATFEKDAIAYSIENLENKRNANGSAINVTGGTLTVSADSESSLIKFSLYGSGMSGITASSGAQVSVKNVEMDFYSGKNGNENLSEAKGISYNTGIFAEGGTVLCDGNTTFKVIGEYSSGIYANNGTINISGSEFTCSVDMGSSTELSSTAISSVGGNIAFNVEKATITSNGLGITVGGGDISFGHTNAETISITTTRGTAIYAYGGALTIDANSTLNVTSAIASGCKWAIDTSSGTSGGTDTGVNINNGIYIDGGTFTSQGEIDITHTGIANNTSTSGIVDSKILSYAVRVDGSDSTSASFNADSLTINTNTDGGGLYVNDGSIELGAATITSVGYGIAMRGGSGDTVKVTGTLGVTTTNATAIYITGGSLTLGGQTTVESTIVNDYTFTNASGTTSYDGVFVENGSITSTGTFGVTFNGLANDGSASADASMVKSYAVRVDGSNGQGNAAFTANNTFTINVVEGGNGGGLYVNRGSITLGGENNGTQTYNTTINSVGYGIALRGSSENDNVTVNGTMNVTAYKATAIYITGGSLTLGGETTVKSTIDSSYIDTLGTSGTVSYDGVFIEGGSLTANSAFNVTHNGVENYAVGYGENAGINSSNAYLDFAIKSFAVRVEGDSGTNVNIPSGTITNNSGGGIFVSGGEVTLNCDVTTTGQDMYTTWYHIPNAASNWSAPMPRTGGHAVQVNGGQLTITGGSYSASRGNGILVKSGTATINSGTFSGNDPSGTDIAGAAASYGFKMYGGTVTIEGGSFGGNGSGGFVMGTSSTEKGVANIYDGSFDVSGQAAFSVYKYANVTFGEKGVKSSILVKGNAAGLTIESTPEGAPTVTIHSGTFESKRDSNGDGIWNGNGNATLTITGGTFIGSSRSGLRLDFANQTPDVKISGGEFRACAIYTYYNFSGITANTTIYVRKIIPDSTIYNNGSQMDITDYSTLNGDYFGGYIVKNLKVG